MDVSFVLLIFRKCEVERGGNYLVFVGQVGDVYGYTGYVNREVTYEKR